MAEKIATRNAYGDAIVALAEQYPELVVLDADLSGATMSKGFSKAYPERFFNMGIAECNMMGVAAGLAACGKKPFASTFAMFAAGRGRRDPPVLRGLRHHADHPWHGGVLPLRRE